MVGSEELIRLQWPKGKTKFLMHLKDKGYSQLGTSGTGNHFVDVGVVTLSDLAAGEFGLEAGEYLAVISHSGSRGVGAKICDRYSKIAQKLTPLPGPYRHLAWLSTLSEEGEEYWTSMNLAGKYASANHHAIHKALAKAFGERPLAQVENHHNFAWLEEHGGRKLYVHRKGATPAAWTKPRWPIRTSRRSSPNRTISLNRLPGSPHDSLSWQMTVSQKDNLDKCQMTNDECQMADRDG